MLFTFKQVVRLRKSTLLQNFVTYMVLFSMSVESKEEEDEYNSQTHHSALHL